MISKGIHFEMKFTTRAQLIYVLFEQAGGVDPSAENLKRAICIFPFLTA